MRFRGIKIFKNTSGFTLPEMMMAAGLVGVVSLAIVQVIDMQKQAVIRSQQNISINTVLYDIQRILNHEESCLKSLEGKNFGTIGVRTPLPQSGADNSFKFVRVRASNVNDILKAYTVRINGGSGDIVSFSAVDAGGNNVDGQSSRYQLSRASTYYRRDATSMIEFLIRFDKVGNSQIGKPQYTYRFMVPATFTGNKVESCKPTYVTTLTDPLRTCQEFFGGTYVALTRKCQRPRFKSYNFTREPNTAFAIDTIGTLQVKAGEVYVGDDLWPVGAPVPLTQDPPGHADENDVTAHYAMLPTVPNLKDQLGLVYAKDSVLIDGAGGGSLTAGGNLIIGGAVHADLFGGSVGTAADPFVATVDSVTTFGATADYDAFKISYNDGAISNPDLNITAGSLVINNAAIANPPNGSTYHISSTAAPETIITKSWVKSMIFNSLSTAQIADINNQGVAYITQNPERALVSHFFRSAKILYSRAGTNYNYSMSDLGGLNYLIIDHAYGGLFNQWNVNNSVASCPTYTFASGVDSSGKFVCSPLYIRPQIANSHTWEQCYNVTPMTGRTTFIEKSIGPGTYHCRVNIDPLNDPSLPGHRDSPLCSALNGAGLDPGWNSYNDFRAVNLTDCPPYDGPINGGCGGTGTVTVTWQSCQNTGVTYSPSAITTPYCDQTPNPPTVLVPNGAGASFTCSVFSSAANPISPDCRHEYISWGCY